MKVAYKPVRSSNILKVFYNQPKRELWVIFRNAPQTVYIYEKVPSTKYQKMIQADSVGKYFRTYVENRHNFSKQVQ
jgi:hypothetical protein